MEDYTIETTEEMLKAMQDITFQINREYYFLCILIRYIKKFNHIVDGAESLISKFHCLNIEFSGILYVYLPIAKKLGELENANNGQLPPDIQAIINQIILEIL